MKHLTKFLLAVVLLLPHAITAAGNSSIIYLVLTKTTPNKEPDTQKRHRIPSLPIECIISQEEGIKILSGTISKSEIISYEIWELESEGYLYSSCDETSFVEMIFALEGDYQIRLITSDYELISNISLQ
ncbi:MAG: hypothetical protein HDR88_11345 [Bacteroides sp.]|nr:hypothetical protein [Bacteroides sp.]